MFPLEKDLAYMANLTTDLVHPIGSIFIVLFMVFNSHTI